MGAHWPRCPPPHALDCTLSPVYQPPSPTPKEAGASHAASLIHPLPCQDTSMTSCCQTLSPPQLLVWPSLAPPWLPGPHPLAPLAGLPRDSKAGLPCCQSHPATLPQGQLDALSLNPAICPCIPELCPLTPIELVPTHIPPLPAPMLLCVPQAAGTLVRCSIREELKEGRTALIPFLLRHECGLETPGLFPHC